MKINKSCKIIIICGPTAAGKTKFAIDVAREFNGEIVSADSMQIYRYMNIGTAKPSLLEQSYVPHHMIDVVDPNQEFNISIYSELARNSIERIISRGKKVFIVGGSGLYIKALIYGVFNIEENKIINKNIRKNIKNDLVKNGINWLYQKLYKVDKIYAKKIHRNDRIRIIRALEIYELTGKSIFSFHNKHSLKFTPYEVLIMGILWPRSMLYERINIRVHDMIDCGILKEVEELTNAGYLSNLRSMNSLGYKHMNNFLSGYKTWNMTIKALKRDHRRYAKRQMTWFKNSNDISWLNINQINKAINLIKSFLKLYFLSCFYIT